MADAIDKVRKLIDGFSVSELTDLIRGLETEKEHRIQTARDDLLQEMQAKASSIGLTLRQLVLGDEYANPEPTKKTRKPRAPEADQQAPSPVAFRSPDGATWSGKGRIPKWLKVAEAEGRNRDEFKAT